MDLSRDIRITLFTFVVMCLAAASNLLFFQGRRFGPPTGAASVERTRAVSEESAPPTAARLGETPRDVPAAASGSPRVADTGALAPMDPAEVVRQVQKNLTVRGYEPGQSDGIPGLITRAAVMAYEFDNGLPLTGDPARELLQHMLVGAAAPPAGRKGPPEVRGQQATDILKWVSRQLSGLGYQTGAQDGAMTKELIQAIREYEAAQKIPVTGRVSAPLVARLTRPPAPAKVSTR